MANTVSVDFITKVVEIEVNDNEKESLTAMAAVNAAKQAANSAVSAGNSATTAANTATALTTWLADKEEITAPAVDATLSVTGAAADAKATGDKIADTVDALFTMYMPVSAWTIYVSGQRAHAEIGTGITSIMAKDPVTNGALVIIGSSDNTYSDRQYESGWLSGDVYLSNLNPALYYQVLFQTNPQTDLDQETVDTVVVKISKGLQNIDNRVATLETTVAGFELEIPALDDALRRSHVLTYQFIRRKYITTNVGIGNTVSFTPTDINNMAYIIVPCKQGDKFILWGRGGSGPRLWAITDDEQKLVAVSVQNLDVPSSSPITVDVNIPTGYFIMNGNTNIGYELTLSTLESADADGVATELFNNMGEKDRFLMSSDIKNVFTTAVSNIPAHPWDNNNGYYSSITVPEMYALWDELVTAHPDELTMTELGLCSDGVNKLRAYKFTPKTVGYKYKPFRPKIMVTCTTHGWEKCGTETLLMLLKMMFASWHLDPVLETLRWDVDWVIVPIVNPYGFNNNTRKNANDVDINRNYAQGWALRTQDTSSSIYQGAAALDQPESTLVNDLMISEKPDIGIDFHDFGGHETRLDWAEYEEYNILAAHIAQVGIDRVNRHIVRQFDFMSDVDPTTAGQTSETIQAGKTVNAYYGNGAKIAYTFETCGELTYEPNKKRFNDNHALACIEMFSNFVAEILTEFYRDGFTTTATVIDDDNESAD